MTFAKALRNSELIVAEQDDAVVGFIHYVMHNDIIDGGPNAFITAFYVTPNYRRKGIGSALLSRTIQDALKKGAVGIESSTTNPEAHRLYEKHGFKRFRGEIFLEIDMTLARSLQTNM
jgi:GNAT superfamily N-acetyltransferase